MYLLNIHVIPQPWGLHATMPRKTDKKERTKRKRIGAKNKTIHLTQGIDERMGEEEQNIKQKEEQKKKQEGGHQPSYPATSLTTRMDHTVVLFGNPPPTG